MRLELPTKEAFASTLAANGSQAKLGKALELDPKYIKEYRVELFGDTPIEDIMNGSAFRKKKAEPLKRTLTKTLTYKITDMAAFEAGGLGTYDGLEFVKEEQIDEVAKVLERVDWNDLSVGTHRNAATQDTFRDKRKRILDAYVAKKEEL
jgi:hypothetical protein